MGVGLFYKKKVKKFKVSPLGGQSSGKGVRELVLYHLAWGNNLALKPLIIVFKLVNVTYYSILL